MSHPSSSFTSAFYNYALTVKIVQSTQCFMQHLAHNRIVCCALLSPENALGRNARTEKKQSEKEKMLNLFPRTANATQKKKRIGKFSFESCECEPGLTGLEVLTRSKMKMRATIARSSNTKHTYNYEIASANIHRMQGIARKKTERKTFTLAHRTCQIISFECRNWNEFNYNYDFRCGWHSSDSFFSCQCVTYLAHGAVLVYGGHHPSLSSLPVTWAHWDLRHREQRVDAKKK